VLLLVDNYDSFTYNLFHYLGELGAKVKVVRNDEITAQEALAMKPEGIVLSPGPCTPNEAGICLDVIEKAQGRMPILGVCLGHQAIGQAYGGRIVRAPEPMHGKLSRVHHTGKSVFRGLNNDFLATRYHSLTIDPHNPDRVYAATDAGLFRSLNSGTTWTEASGGPSWPMTSLTIDPLDSNRVYAGSAGGIFVITFKSDSGRVQDEPRGN